jgi:uncharacterized protein (DUF1800 family)
MRYGKSFKAVRRVSATRLLLLSAALWQAAAGGAAAQAVPAASAEESAKTLHLLRRATWGVTPADLAAVQAEGRDAWLERQLHPERIPDAELAPRLASFDALGLSMPSLAVMFQPQNQVIRQLQAMNMVDVGNGVMRPDSTMTRQDLSPEMRRQIQQSSPQQLLNQLVSAKLVRSVHTERQLEEVMTDFWFNHFNVFFGKNQVRYAVDDYERDAIRPHVFGKFEDMLMATAKHPAMLFYLDNAQSVVPDSMRDMNAAQMRQVDRLRQMTPAERERLIASGRITPAQQRQLQRLEAMGPNPMPAVPQRGRGMNENYARELMELHTLGVDGGYTQADVIEVARALTGWTFVPFGGRGGGAGRGAGAGAGANVEPGEFVFNAVAHDRREKTVLGQRLPAGRGIEDGEAVIHMLATHPSTANFIATKLVERFVSDKPEPAYVEEIAQVFLRTDGDLREVTRALFTSPRFYAAEVRGTKVKTPFELVASALRVTHSEVGASQRTMQTLRSMGHLPYSEPAPTGFPASSEDWVNSGAMLARMNFGLDLAEGRVDRTRPDLQVLAPGVDQRDTNALVRGVLASVLPGTDTESLAKALVADLEKNGTGAARARAARTIGLAIGSPEFQRR